MTIREVQCNLRPVNTCALKLSETVRPDCCQVPEPIPSDAQCFLKDICKELCKLTERHNNMFVKRPRIMELALPLRRRCRFVPRCTCPFEKNIEIVPADRPQYTRTEQLALPPVRRLLIHRQNARNRGDFIAETILNRLLRYSLLSLYSRLGNIQAPKKGIKKKKMSVKEKKRHIAYTEKLAKPKVALKPSKVERKKGEINQRRLKKLARPKKFIEEIKPAWELTPMLRFYRATKRIQEISKPLERENTQINEEPFKIELSALKYKATQRIKDLAQPLAMRVRKAIDADLKENPFSISPNALKYKASARIKELAEPKEYENTHIRENPFLISLAALKAKASPRTIELAKPKGS